MVEVMRCPARGCGVIITYDQIRAWKGRKGNKGPFCSRECYNDHNRRPLRVDVKGKP